MFSPVQLNWTFTLIRSGNVIRNLGFLQRNILNYPTVRKASRDVENLTERKNLHTQVYAVKEFVCLSITLTPIISGMVNRIGINKLWHLVYDGIIRLWNGLITPVNIFFQIENITTEDGVKLSDICNNPLEGQTDACNIQNIWAYWQDSLDNLNKVATPAEFPNATYNYLDHFISCSKWVFCSCPIHSQGELFINAIVP